MPSQPQLPLSITQQKCCYQGAANKPEQGFITASIQGLKVNTQKRSCHLCFNLQHAAYRQVCAPYYLKIMLLKKTTVATNFQFTTCSL
jgi:hypothetical protein